MPTLQLVVKSVFPSCTDTGATATAKRSYPLRNRGAQTPAVSDISPHVVTPEIPSSNPLSSAVAIQIKISKGGSGTLGPSSDIGASTETGIYPLDPSAGNVSPLLPGSVTPAAAEVQTVQQRTRQRSKPSVIRSASVTTSAAATTTAVAVTTATDSKSTAVGRRVQKSSQHPSATAAGRVVARSRRSSSAATASLYREVSSEEDDTSASDDNMSVDVADLENQDQDRDEDQEQNLDEDTGQGLVARGPKQPRATSKPIVRTRGEKSAVALDTAMKAVAAASKQQQEAVAPDSESDADDSDSEFQAVAAEQVNKRKQAVAVASAKRQGGKGKATRVAATAAKARSNKAVKKSGDDSDYHMSEDDHNGSDDDDDAEHGDEDDEENDDNDDEHIETVVHVNGGKGRRGSKATTGRASGCTKLSKGPTPAKRGKSSTAVCEGAVEAEDNDDTIAEPATAGGSSKNAPAGRGKAATKAGPRRGGKQRDVAADDEGENAKTGKDKKAKGGKGGNDDDNDVWGPFGEQELEDMDIDTQFPATEMMEPPPELLMPLLPFQKQFLAWAMKQVGAGGGGVRSSSSLYGMYCLRQYRKSELHL